MEFGFRKKKVNKIYDFELKKTCSEGVFFLPFFYRVKRQKGIIQFSLEERPVASFQSRKRDKPKARKENFVSVVGTRGQLYECRKLALGRI